VIQDVSTQNTSFFLNQEIATSEGTSQENQVQHDDRSDTPPTVESCQFAVLAGDRHHAELLNRFSGQQGNVCSCVHQ